MHIVTDALLAVTLAFKEPKLAEAELPFTVGKAIGEKKAKARRLPVKQAEKPVETQPSTQRLAIQASFYTAYCAEGCIGVTATGIDVSKSQHFEGRRIIAVDPNFIALGSTGTLTLSNGESYSVVAQDTGGAIKGNRIDVLVASHNEAIALGRLTGTITLD